MNKSLQHLPEHKQEEIKALARIIRMSDLNMLKLVLFGSYARGSYVEEYCNEKPRSGSNQTFEPGHIS